MKIKNKKQTNKISVYVVIIITLVLAGCAGVFAYKNLTNSNDSATNEPSTTEEKKDNEKDTSEEESTDPVDESGEEKTEPTDTPDDDPTNGGKTPPRYEGGNIQDNKTLTGAINGISVAGNNLSIRVTVNQYISDPDGRCELTLTSPSGATYDYWSGLVQNPQSTSCYGWDIPLSDFGGSVSGHWTAKVVVNGDGRTGTFTQETDL